VGEIIKASELDAPLSLKTKVCIIGSGAGGAVLAMRLTEAGIDTIMLEAGPLVSSEDFTLREDEAYPLLYQDRGARVSGDGAITIMQGRSVGGGTTVNWTSCYRTPEPVLRHWSEVHGVKSLTSKRLEPHFEAIEKLLSIAPWPESLSNANNRKLFTGARKLGWQVEPTRRNVAGCVSSGYCGMGCPVDAKQAMHLTTIPAALKAGMTLIAECPVLRLEKEGARVSAVVARAQAVGDAEPKGQMIRVEAELVVVSAGALNGPALLLRSQINPGGKVGKRTFLHPVVAMIGRYAEPVHAFYGPPQSVASHQFIKPQPGGYGMFIESAPVHPMLAASVLPASGLEIADLLADLAHMGALIALHVDGFEDEGGSVSLRPGGLPKLDYPVSRGLAAAMKLSHKRLAELSLAAGAEWVASLHPEQMILRNKADLKRLDGLEYGAFAHTIFSAHQMGGCAMGHRGVVDEHFALRGMDNLYVVDGSLFPTSLGVNPSQSIYGLAHLAAEEIAKAVGVKL
jgi:choline dehydrogenase-like flavoprotein